jgi:hypothetical protein
MYGPPNCYKRFEREKNVCKDCSKKNFNTDQKARRNEMSAEMLERLETEPDIVYRFIIGDEHWFFEYYPETKVQCHTPQSPMQKKVRMSKYIPDNDLFFFSILAR